MAGSAEFSYQVAPDGKSVELKWKCTTAAAGGSPELTSPSITQPGDTLHYKYNSPFTGQIGTVTITPDGTAPPTAGYDAELRDAVDSGIDYLGGMGDNLSATATKVGTPLDEVSGVTFDLINRRLVPYAANAGNSKIFTIAMILRLKDK